MRFYNELHCYSSQSYESLENYGAGQTKFGNRGNKKKTRWVWKRYINPQENQWQPVNLNVCCAFQDISIRFVHDDVIKWKHFPRYWPFVRGIHRSPVNSPHKGQWRGALKFSLICARMNGWVNNREAGDLRRHQAHCDVIVMRVYIWWLGTNRYFRINSRTTYYITLYGCPSTDEATLKNTGKYVFAIPGEIMTKTEQNKMQHIVSNLWEIHG